MKVKICDFSNKFTREQERKIKTMQKTEGSKKPARGGKTGHTERVRNKNKILIKKLSATEAGRQ